MPNIPNSVGSDLFRDGDVFEAEEVESVWHIDKGEKLPFTGNFNGCAVRTNGLGDGRFGDAFAVRGWLGEGIPSFPTNHAESGDLPLAKSCCVKIFKRNVIDGEKEGEYERRARKEYEILLSAGGANGCVTLPLGFGRAFISGDKYWCIVMEHLTVGDGNIFLLWDERGRLSADGRCAPGRMSPKQAATFAYNLALSLRDLHNCRDGRGITHRDLWPTNVAVRLSENNGVMKSLAEGTDIVDRVFFLDLGQSTLPERNVTPVIQGARLAQSTYGAPEMFDVDDRTWQEGSLWKWRNKPTVDIWSMGALIYFFVMGRGPRFKEQSFETTDNRELTMREKYTLPKVDGLSIPESDIEGSSDRETMRLLDKTIRSCTVYNPEERACVARLDDIINDLGEALGIEGGVTPIAVIPVTTRQTSLGPIEFEIRKDYQVDSQLEEYCARHRTDSEDRTFQLIMRFERHIFTEEEKEEYTNAVISRIGTLFMSYGGDDSSLNLETLAHHGAFVRPGRDNDYAYRVISFTTMQKTRESFITNVRIYFFEGVAFIVGLGCLCSEDGDYQVKLEIEREMELLGSSVRLSSLEER